MNFKRLYRFLQAHMSSFHQITVVLQYFFAVSMFCVNHVTALALHMIRMSREVTSPLASSLLCDWKTTTDY